MRTEIPNGTSLSPVRERGMGVFVGHSVTLWLRISIKRKDYEQENNSFISFNTNDYLGRCTNA